MANPLARGYIHYKFAPFDLSGIPQVGAHHGHPPDNANLQWDQHWQSQFDSSNDPDVRWKVVNQFCIKQLLHQSATWGAGPQQRASPPRFIAKTICPAQHPNHCAATRHSTALFKLHNRLQELWVRHSRGSRSEQDWFIFVTAFNRITKSLIALHADIAWTDVHSISLVSIQLPSTGCGMLLTHMPRPSRKSASLGGNVNCSTQLPRTVIMFSITLVIDCRMNPPTLSRIRMATFSFSRTRRWKD